MNSLLDKALTQLNDNNFAEAATSARMILQEYPSHYRAHNILGISLQMQNNYPEAINVFEKAAQINPKDIAAWTNLASTYAKWQKPEKAIQNLDMALEAEPNNVTIIRYKAHLYTALNRHDKALECLNKALLQLPNDLALLSAKAQSLRYLNLTQEALALLNHIVAINPSDVKAILELADAYYRWAGDSGNAKKLYNMAYAKEPTNPEVMQKMCTFFHECHYGSEAENLAITYALAKKLADISPPLDGIAGTVQSVALGMLDHDLYNKFGSRLNEWVGQEQLGRVITLQDRLDLISSHRIAGKMFEDIAAANPIKYKVRQRLDNKTRIGILSADLRKHSVGYFAWPAIRYIDHSKFDIYCYSAYPYKADDMQQSFIQQVESFKSYTKETPHAIAQAAADDHLDVLLDLGGLTLFSKVEVCAYRPAPMQISWLGYVHPVGFANTIDYLMLDPYIKPDNHDLLIEKPLVLPHTWVAIDEEVFIASPIAKSTAEDRNGYVTFGSFNASYKLTPEAIEVWAQIMHMVPNSRFIYMRPETVATPLQENLRRRMASHGISADRVSFISARDNYRSYYNNIDISLDTFPHTGGTVTCEALWMGVPVVTLVGQSFFERVSYSNLVNSGLSDLAAFTIQKYKDIAVKLAFDKERRRYLLHNLRKQIQQGPLGQPQQFGKDFGNLIASTL